MKYSINTLTFWKPVLKCFIFLLMWVSFFVLHPFILLLISLSQCLKSLTVSLSLCLPVCGVWSVWWHGYNARWDLLYLASLPLHFCLSCLLNPNSVCLFNLTFILTRITWLWVHFLLSSLSWRLSLFSTGDVLFQMAEVHRQIQVQLEEMVCTLFDRRPFSIFVKGSILHRLD